MSLVVKDEAGEVISFIMTAIHEKTATYYIGWSNSEGYKCNASRLLLWASIRNAKENGIEWFDLGGIDFVNTKGIAEFKKGSGCQIYEYIGEFI